MTRLELLELPGREGEGTVVLSLFGVVVSERGLEAEVLCLQTPGTPVYEGRALALPDLPVGVLLFQTTFFPFQTEES